MIEPKKPPPFTADNLPEAARATDADMAQWFVIAPVRAAANQHAALVLDRLDAAHGGRLSALLNGTAPAFTDEPPKVTYEDRENAHAAYLKTGTAQVYSAWGRILEADRARVWQTHRPKPVDPVRFALEKVDMQALCEVARKRSGTDNGIAFVSEQNRRNLVAELARILPVAEPPRKVEVTPEILEIALNVYREDEGEIGDSVNAAVIAAFAVANAQAEARESEAVAEVERLRSLIGDENITALSEGRARIIPANQAPGMPNAKCHACGIGDYCGNADCPNAGKEIERLTSELEALQAQTPAPEAELKRWKIKPSDEDAFEHIVTQRMTRADAESLGEVIGEA